MGLENHKFFPKREGIVAAIILLFILLFVTYFIYKNAIEAQKGEIFEGLKRTTKVIRTLIDTDQHELLQHADQQYSQLYNEQLIPLKKALDSDHTIEFIYTMIRKDSLEDAIYFVLDPTTEGDADNDGVEDKSFLMEKYDDPSRELINSFKHQEIYTSKEPYKDQWGDHVSCYVPLFNTDKKFIGVLGIDISAKTYYERLKPMERATQRAVITIFCIAYLSGLGIWFLRHFSKEIYKKMKL